MKIRHIKEGTDTDLIDSRVLEDIFIICFLFYRRARFTVPFKVLCGVLAFLTFVYAATLTEGYSSTCREYRGIVRRTVNVSFILFDLSLNYLCLVLPTNLGYFTMFQANADVTEMIQNRLSCAATYDFLDYLQTQSSRYPIAGPQYSHYYRRTFRLDTAAILLVAITLSWTNFAIWIFLTLSTGFCS